MRDRRRTAVIAVAGLALVAAAVAHPPTADIRVLTHDAADMSPHRIQAAIDVGVFGVSVLVTWTAKRLR